MKKVLLLLFATFCIKSNLLTETNFDEKIFNWTRTFAEVIDLMHQKYYKDFDPKESMIKAIKSFVELDPHSSFLDSESFKSLLQSTNGEFFGIGVIVSNKKDLEDEFLMVLETVPGSPADSQGLKAGDKIIEIDGTILKGINTDTAAGKLKGPKGTIVHIKAIREGSPEILKFDIKRDLIKEPTSLCYYFKDSDIYYISVTVFSKNSAEQLEKFIRKINQKKYKGLILDLRNNSGGLLDSAVEIAELFVNKNSLVAVAKNKDNQTIEEYITKKDPIFQDVAPIFVLVNNYTASAAEILAGCLSLDKRLKVFTIGTNSFGKGSVQEVIPVTNDCAIKATIAIYYLADNTPIQGIGIKPDFEIEMMYPPSDQILWMNKFYGHENSLKDYIKIEEETEEKTKEKDWKEKKQDVISSDFQIQNTVSIINLLSLTKLDNKQDAINFIKKNYFINRKINLEEIAL